MSYPEAYDEYIESGDRFYRPYLENDPNIKFGSDVVRLYRRTLDVNVPQLATAFRDVDLDRLDVQGIVDLSKTVKLPDWYENDPFEQYSSAVDRLGKTSPSMPGCVIPIIDRMQAVYTQRAYGIPTVWLSATHDEQLARRRIFPHMNLLVLDVPVDYVLPIAKIIEATDEQIGYKDTIEDAEVGIFGGIKPDWIVDIETSLKQPPHVLRSARRANLST